MLDAAPYIREAQLKVARALPDVGFAPAYDQQVPWYHPHKKVQLGERMARWALATQYAFKLGYELPVCVAAKPEGGKMIVEFDRAVQTHGGRPMAGFAVAGADKRFVPAHARYVVVGKDNRGRAREDRRKLEVWSELVPEPVAVRYAWARNPLGNLVNSQHHERVIPVPSFRTDDSGWGDAPFGSEARNELRQRRAQMRREAEDHMRHRKLQEARLLLKRLETEAAAKK